MNAVVERPMEGEVYKPSRMLDPTRFQYLWQLSERIVASSLVPDSLKKIGSGNQKTDLPPETVLANVFAVVEQADRWDISPFALIQGASIVHGKLCFEGKIIAGVLEARLGIRLHYEFNGQTGDALGVRVFAKRPGDEAPVEVSGTVGQWKTTGTGTPWGDPRNHPRQMCYRGAREWTRIHEPAIMLGVFADDEMMVLAYEAAAQAATPVPSLADRLRASDAAIGAGEGFSATGARQALEDKRHVPMDPIKPRERELVPPQEIKTTEPNADASSGRREAQPASSGASAPKADAPAAGSPQTVEPPQEQPRENPARAKVTLLEPYARRLQQAQNVDEITKLNAEFWRERGGMPKDEDILSSMRVIYRNARRLHSDEITAATFEENLRAELYP